MRVAERGQWLLAIHLSFQVVGETDAMSTTGVVSGATAAPTSSWDAPAYEKSSLRCRFLSETATLERSKRLPRTRNTRQLTTSWSPNIALFFSREFTSAITFWRGTDITYYSTRTYCARSTAGKTQVLKTRSDSTIPTKEQQHNVNW